MERGRRGRGNQEERKSGKRKKERTWSVGGRSKRIIAVEMKRDKRHKGRKVRKGKDWKTGKRKNEKSRGAGAGKKMNVQ